MLRATTKAPSLADGPTLASTRDYLILDLRSEGKSERTISTYLRALDRRDAFPVERGMPRALGAIRREHLEAFFVALGELGNAPATISMLFRALRPFWRWLVEEDEIERTPMERMRAPSVPLNSPHIWAERFIKTLLHEWAYGRLYRSIAVCGPVWERYALTLIGCVECCRGLHRPEGCAAGSLSPYTMNDVAGSLKFITAPGAC